MYPTLLDVDTGLTHTLPDHEASVFQWCEDSHACDCNRSRFVGAHLGMTGEAVERFAAETDDTCIARRFVMVDAHGDLEGRTVEEVVAAANSDYPDVARHRAWAWRRAQESLALQAELHAILDQVAPPQPAAGRARL